MRSSPGRGGGRLGCRRGGAGSGLRDAARGPRPAAHRCHRLRRRGAARALPGRPARHPAGAARPPAGRDHGARAGPGAARQAGVRPAARAARPRRPARAVRGPGRGAARATWRPGRPCRPTSTSSCTAPATVVLRPAHRRGVRDQRARHPGAARGARRRRRPRRTSCTCRPPTSPGTRTGGRSRERAVRHGIDWRAEAEAAARLRVSVEDASRAATALERFAREARREHRRAGPARCRRRRRAAPPHLGRRPARRRRPRAGPLAGLHRLLHVHQGDGRARARGAAPPTAR